MCLQYSFDVFYIGIWSVHDSITFFSIFHCTVGKPMENVARVALVNLWYRILIVIISKNRTLILYENSK